MQKELLVSLHSEKQIPAAKLKALFDSEPWWPERSIANLEPILDSFPAVGAWDGEKLVGFGRVITDSKFRANIEDMLVLEGYRKRGIGLRIMRLLMDAVADIDVVTLFCQGKLAAYYESLGFKEFSRQVVMQKRNRPNRPV